MFTRPPLVINKTKTSIMEYLNAKTAGKKKKKHTMSPFQSIDEKRTISRPISPRAFAKSTLQKKMVNSMMVTLDHSTLKGKDDDVPDLKHEIYDHEVLTAHSSRRELNDSEEKMAKTQVSQNAESPLLTNT